MHRLRTSSRRDSAWHERVLIPLGERLALLLAWFVVRILWGYTSSYFFWADSLAAYREASIRWPILAWYMVANVSLNLLNTVWFYKIVKGAVKALT